MDGPGTTADGGRDRAQDARAAATVQAAAAVTAQRGTPPARSAGRVAVLLVVDVLPRHRLWGWSRFVLRRWPLRAVAGLRFAKILGSGKAGGFGMRPSGSIQGLFCTFDGDAQADAFLASPLAAAYRARAGDWLSVRLHPFSVRGSWDGAAPEVVAAPPPTGPIAALTRASIRPRRAAEFWTHALPSERALANAPGCLLAVGLGESPLLRQATFSVWDSIASMDRYARGGAHQQAILAARAGDYFSESMFVRFVPSALRLRWQGRTHG